MMVLGVGVIFLNTSIMSREIKEDLLKSGLLPKADKSGYRFSVFPI